MASCPNCGSERHGSFCSACGQKDQPLRQSTLQFVRQALNEYFGVDGRLWITLRLLAFRPGHLTSEHLRGRRKRYLAPLRLYLSATLLFFFLLSVLDPAAKIEKQIRGSARDTTTTVQARLVDIEGELQSIDERIAGIRETPDETRADSAIVLSQQRVDRDRLEWQRSILSDYPPDSTIRPADLIDAAELLYRDEIRGIEVSGFGDNGPTRGPLKRIGRARTRSEMAAALSDFARGLIERIPVVMFLMLPVFALLMKLAYIRRDWYYGEHLIFALHNHAVAFFGFTLIAVLAAAAGDRWFVSPSAAAVLVLLNGYFLLAQKNVYGQGWAKTSVKFVLVFVSYWTAIMFFGLSILVILGTLVG